MNRADVRKKLGLNAKKVEKKFVYLLTLEEVVVYVGQTLSLESRLTKHSRDGKHFDDFSYIECHPDDANNLEAQTIVMHNPKYNSCLPKNELYKSGYFFKSTICKSIAAMINKVKPQYTVRTDCTSHISSSNNYSIEQIEYVKRQIDKCCIEIDISLRSKEFK